MVSLNLSRLREMLKRVINSPSAAVSNDDEKRPTAHLIESFSRKPSLKSPSGISKRRSQSPLKSIEPRPGLFSGTKLNSTEEDSPYRRISFSGKDKLGVFEKLEPLILLNSHKSPTLSRDEKTVKPPTSIAAANVPRIRSKPLPLRRSVAARLAPADAPQLSPGARLASSVATKATRKIAGRTMTATAQRGDYVSFSPHTVVVTTRESPRSRGEYEYSAAGTLVRETNETSTRASTKTDSQSREGRKLIWSPRDIRFGKSASPQYSRTTTNTFQPESSFSPYRYSRVAISASPSFSGTSCATKTTPAGVFSSQRIGPRPVKPLLKTSPLATNVRYAPADTCRRDEIIRQSPLMTTAKRDGSPQHMFLVPENNTTRGIVGDPPAGASGLPTQFKFGQMTASVRKVGSYGEYSGQVSSTGCLRSNEFRISPVQTITRKTALKKPQPLLAATVESTAIVGTLNGQKCNRTLFNKIGTHQQDDEESLRDIVLAKNSQLNPTGCGAAVILAAVAADGCRRIGNDNNYFTSERKVNPPIIPDIVGTNPQCIPLPDDLDLESFTGYLAPQPLPQPGMDNIKRDTAPITSGVGRTPIARKKNGRTYMCAEC